MATCIVMAILFALGGLTAEVRHETSGWYSRREPNAAKRNRAIKIDRAVNYTLAIGFIVLGVYFAVS